MDNKDDKKETVEIDPGKVYISGGEQQRSGGFFDSVFGGIFDVFSDDEEDDDFPVDVFDRDFVEVNEVEIIDRDGNVHRSKDGKINDANVDKQSKQTKQTAFDKFKSKFKK